MSNALHPGLGTPLQLGPVQLPNRVVMAPMTRLRASADGTPGELSAHYYAQRASAGLIIGEATAVSRQGSGYVCAPGLHTADHRRGWRAVTDAVHAAGGRIAVQLFHAGRISHPDFFEGALPVAPSAVAAGPADATYDTMHNFVVPRALEAVELPGAVAQFRRSAELALDAGFDLVEVHAANGYLLDQFLQTGSNRRTDDYGGSAEHRVRLLDEVVQAVAAVWGAERVGVRVSPKSTVNGMVDAAPEETFGLVAQRLSERGVAYLHVIEPGVQGAESAPAAAHSGHLGSGWFRPLFSGCVISVGGHTAQTAQQRLANDEADLIAFGKAFIANPDLPERLLTGAPLAMHNPATIYGGGATGYVDYPRYAATEQAA